ncbi:hypothetical protein ACQ4M3_23890 [Leptolyngbya sp. AN03gr2]
MTSSNLLAPAIPPCAVGSWGHEEADDLLYKDQRQWWGIGI